MSQDPRRSWRRTFANSALIGFAYFVCSWLLWFADGGTAHTERLWMPVGIVLGGILVYGLGAAVGAGIGGALFGVTVGAPTAVVVGHALAAGIPAAAGALALRARLGRDVRLDHTPALLLLLPVALGVGLLSSLLVRLGTVVAGDASIVGIIAPAAAIGVAESVGVLVFAPLMSAMLGGAPRGDTRHLLETGGVYAALVAIGVLAWSPLAVDAASAPLAFAAIPLLIWTSLRFGVRRATAAVTIIAVFAIGGTLRGEGLFATSDTAAYPLQAYLAAVAVSTYIVAALVNERTVIRSSLEATERRWEDLIHAAPDGILAVDRKGIITLTNNRGGPVFKDAKAGVDLVSLVAPSDQQMVREKLNVVFWHGTSTVLEIPFGDGEGQRRWYSLQVGPMRRGDRIDAAMIIASDITERRLTAARLRDHEARVRAFYDQSPLAIAIIGLDGRFLEANHALGELFAAPDVDMRSYRWLDLVEADDQARAQDLFEEMVERGRARFDAELRMLRRDGGQVMVRLGAHLVRDAAGQPSFVAGMLEDVTAKHRATKAEALAASRAQKIGHLEEVSAWKSQLLNIASHEIRNPLTPMKLQLDLMEQGIYGNLSPKQEKAVTIMKRECNRLADLVTGILDVARIETNRLAVERTPMDLAAVAREVAESVEISAQEAGITLDVEAPDTVAVHADAARVKQVVFNLMSNALKFTPRDGNVRLAVRQAGNVAQVEVQDTGPGLNQEQIGKLFQAFSQVHDVSSGDKKGGIGLGLYIAKGVVESHGGRMWVTSDGPGKGATFAFTIPLPRRNAQDPNGASSAAAPSPRPAPA